MDNNHSHIANDVNSELGSLKTKIEGIFENLLKNKDAAVDKVKDAADRATTTVRAQRLISMFVMLLIGILVGRLYAMMRKA